MLSVPQELIGERHDFALRKLRLGLTLFSGESLDRYWTRDRVEAIALKLSGLRCTADLIETAKKPSDDLLGVYFVHVENVDGLIVTKILPATQSISDGASTSAAGDSAKLKSSSDDGEFSIRTSVLEN